MTFPLTTFLIAMLKADPATLGKANAGKLARKYGISEAHVAGYLRMHGPGAKIIT